MICLVIFDLFSGGFSWDKAKEWIQAYEKGEGLSSVALKWSFLFWIIVLVYSALNKVEFPDNTSLRWILSIAVAILFTFSINSSELISILRSYTAGGVAMLLFVPVMILGFFTFTMAVKVNVVGLVLQRILWAAR